MPERPRLAGDIGPPHYVLDIGVPGRLTRTGSDVTTTVTGPCGTVELTVTLRARPPAEDATGVLLVVVAGVIDMCTAPVLEAALSDAVDRHTTVRCDLADVRVLSAAGVTTLIKAYQRATRTGSRLTVCGAHGLTLRVLQVTGVDQVLREP